MKYLGFLFVYLLFLFYSEKTYSQINPDTLWAHSVKSMKKQLQLSDATALLLLQIGQEQLRQTALLNGRKALSADEREKELKKIQQQFHQGVQHVLTSEQWKGYKDLEEAMRTKFINDANSKHKVYKELGI